MNARDLKLNYIVRVQMQNVKLNIAKFEEVRAAQRALCSARFLDECEADLPSAAKRARPDEQKA